MPNLSIYMLICMLTPVVGYCFGVMVDAVFGLDGLS